MFRRKGRLSRAQKKDLEQIMWEKEQGFKVCFAKNLTPSGSCEGDIKTWKIPAKVEGGYNIMMDACDGHAVWLSIVDMGGEVVTDKPDGTTKA